MRRKMQRCSVAALLLAIFRSDLTVFPFLNLSTLNACFIMELFRPPSPFPGFFFSNSDVYSFHIVLPAQIDWKKQRLNSIIELWLKFGLIKLWKQLLCLKFRFIDQLFDFWGNTSGNFEKKLESSISSYNSGSKEFLLEKWLIIGFRV